MSVLRRTPLEFDAAPYLAVKDPCPVFDGDQWHLYGTGITGPHQFELLHATAPDVTGPWELQRPVAVDGLRGTCLAAPGVIVDSNRRFHLFLQTDYNQLDGRIEHLVSADKGYTFDYAGTALESLPGTDEAGIYDPHPAEIQGDRYLVYSAFRTVGEPDIHLARSRSGTWNGPWERLGPILRHEDVDWHNQRGCDDYEWGLEGAQLVELPDGSVLLNVVCFLAGSPAGCRQRVVIATATDPAGPYTVLGRAVEPHGGESSGENGHGTVVVHGDELVLFFQERPLGHGDWDYALATAPLAAVLPVRTAEEEAA